MLKEVNKNISHLKIGETAIIEKIVAQSELKARLLSLGFIKDMKIKLLSSSIAKATFVVLLNEKNQYALRANEAKNIIVKD